MDKTKIKVEPFKTEKLFVDFVDDNGMKFEGMYFPGDIKKHVFWIKAFSDVPITDIITGSLENIDFGYIAYSGKINGKYCVAAEIKS